MDHVGFTEFRRQVREEYELSRRASADEDDDEGPGHHRSYSEEEFTEIVKTRWISLDPRIRGKFNEIGALRAGKSSTGLKRKAVAKEDPDLVDFVDDVKTKIPSFKNPKTVVEVSQPVTMKKKIKRDPNAPRKPRNSYIFFYLEQGERLKSEVPEASLVERTKEIARRWSVMDASAKSKYEVESVKDKMRYDAEMARYSYSSSSMTMMAAAIKEGPTSPEKLMKSLTVTKVTTKKKKSSVKPKVKIEGPRPRKPISAYQIYVKERSAELKRSNPSPAKGSPFQIIAKEFKTLEETALNVLVHKSEIDKKRYLREIALFRQGKYLGPMEEAAMSRQDSDGDDPLKSDESMLPSQ